MIQKETYCKYCNELIKGKSYTADSHRYHIKCLRKFRRDIDKQKMNGKIREGQENTVKVNNNRYINESKLQK